MKLIWSPETAAKAYIDTVKCCGLDQESGVPELISAMAAGWNAKAIVETWAKGGAITTSIGLQIASIHSGGRHMCMVPDEESRSEYCQGMEAAGISSCSRPEVVICEPELKELLAVQGIDFLVVDCRRRDFGKVLRLAQLSNKGAVLVCKNATVMRGSVGAEGFRWGSELDGGRRVVRTAFLPVGKGLDIAYVAAVNGSGCGGGRVGKRRWIQHVDRKSGEVNVIRR